MGNACVFSLISHNMGKDSQSHRMGKVWKIGSQQFPRKHIVCGELGKFVFIFSHSMGAIFHRFPSYGVLHHMGNAWVFS